MRQRTDELYPLKFVALAKEKVWGGAKIAGWFPQEAVADRLIGEVWTVWDQLVVDNGSLRGRKLADLVRDEPLAILGSRLATASNPVFPLLVKLLEAQETLSIQVHPDDAYAQEHEGEPFGKAEVWYVLDAEPGYRFVHGVKRPVTRDEAKQAIEDGTLQELLAYVDAAAGDVVFNIPGTIHALPGGVLLYELQQSSDLTYRLYDWDRRHPERPLHVEKSLDVANLEPFRLHKVKPIELGETTGARRLLCACKHFAAELLTVPSFITERPAGTCFHILTALRGAGYVRHDTRPGMDVDLHPGESVLVPASIHEYELHAHSEEEPLAVVKAYVPDLLEDVVKPLRERGVPEQAIVQLGGDPRYSDLGRLGQQAGRET